MLIAVLGIYLFIEASTAQVGTCQWEEFNLIQAQGYEILCVESSGTYAIGYTPCMSYALCSGSRYQAVRFDRFSGVCQYYLAEWDDGETEPQFSYDDDGIQQWTFYYENAAPCGQDENPRGFNIIWKCDPMAVPFSTSTQCRNVNECLDEMTIRSSAACVEGPPPQTECKWGNFDLTSIFDLSVPITCNDNTGGANYEYTPCQDKAICDGQEFQATLFNQNEGNCLPLSQWDYGVTQPEYFNNGGTPAWNFYYKNGQQTEQCPNGIEFDISWQCNFECNPWCLNTQCFQSNECKYSLTIDSVLACKLPTDEEDDGMILSKLKMLMQNSSKILNKHTQNHLLK